MKVMFAAILGLAAIPLLSWGVFAWAMPIQAAPPTVPPCEPVGTMGMVTLYRCVDEDYNKVCYLQSISGMVFCLEE